jgi:hypothetical protein
MSLLGTPRVADLLARIMQSLVLLTAGVMERRTKAGFPEFPAITATS